MVSDEVQAPLLDGEPQRGTGSRMLKAGVALIGGSCLVLLSVMAVLAYAPAPHSTDVAETDELLAMPTMPTSSLRVPTMPSPALPLPPAVASLRNLPGASPWKELALAGLADSSRCGQRNVAASANNFKAVMASLSGADRANVVRTVSADSLLGGVGKTAPLGFWDPQGWTTGSKLTDGRMLWYREAEIKHGRVCMLATLGILVAEKFHPLYGGNIDVDATKVFQQVPLDLFWPISVLQFMVAAAFEEVRTSPRALEGRGLTGFGGDYKGEEWFIGKKTWADGTPRTPGDLGWDPLKLKPKTEKGLVEMQNKEINNGRLAMFAVMGILAQEYLTGQKIFG